MSKPCPECGKRTLTVVLDLPSCTRGWGQGEGLSATADDDSRQDGCGWVGPRPVDTETAEEIEEYNIYANDTRTANIYL